MLGLAEAGSSCENWGCESTLEWGVQKGTRREAGLYLGSLASWTPSLPQASISTYRGRLLRPLASHRHLPGLKDPVYFSIDWVSSFPYMSCLVRQKPLGHSTDASLDFSQKQHHLAFHQHLQGHKEPGHLFCFLFLGLTDPWGMNKVLAIGFGLESFWQQETWRGGAINCFFFFSFFVVVADGDDQSLCLYFFFLLKSFSSISLFMFSFLFLLVFSLAD